VKAVGSWQVLSSEVVC